MTKAEKAARVEAAARDWASGTEGSRDVAARYGVSDAAVCRAAKRLGLTAKPRPSRGGKPNLRTAEVEAAAREWVLGNGSSRKVAKRANVSDTTMRRTAVRLGLIPPPKSRPKDDGLSPEDLASWAETRRKAMAIRARRERVLRCDPYAPAGVEL